MSQDATLATGTGGAAATVGMLYAASGHLWAMGAIFFGLWLVPMGWLARRSGWMPAPMGWLLMVGGLGYVASALLAYLLPAAGLAVELLTVPASIGEFWMVGYLCLKGVRRAPALPAERT